ncbi:hypothetical protein PSTG_17297, partial [Puccinia striiformis f. sp. tritici PST-78]
VGLASDLQESIELAGDRNQANPEDQLVVRITGLEPDLVLSLDSGIALLDSVMGKRTGFIKLDLFETIRSIIIISQIQIIPILKPLLFLALDINRALLRN